MPTLGSEMDEAARLDAAASAVEVALTGEGSLPPGICVKSVRPIAYTFHARESCLGKRYIYTIAEGLGNGDPFLARRAWVLGRGKILDVSAMSAAARLVASGRPHDFSSFGVGATSSIPYKLSCIAMA